MVNLDRLPAASNGPTVYVFGTVPYCINTVPLLPARFLKCLLRPYSIVLWPLHRAFELVTSFYRWAFVSSMNSLPNLPLIALLA